MKRSYDLKALKNTNLRQPDSALRELQNKPNFIKIGSQNAKIALRVGKILIIYIIRDLK
jgi:hypothetical protein